MSESVFVRVSKVIRKWMSECVGELRRGYL